MDEREREYYQDVYDSVKKSAAVEKLAMDESLGTEEIVRQFAVLAEIGKSGNAFDRLDAGRYLETAAIALWKRSGRIEPALYLAHKYYVPQSAHNDDTHDFESVISDSCSKILAAVSADLQGEDRTKLINHAVTFLTEAEDSEHYKQVALIVFASQLSECGALDEGRSLAQTIAATVDDQFKTDYEDFFILAETGQDPD